MSTAAQVSPPARSRGVSIPRGANFALAVGLFVVALLVPFAIDQSGTLMSNLVLAAAYSVMALGLNIIVGFAGLLDLGYVAFFALGSFAMGYAGSGFLNVGGNKGVHVLVSSALNSLAGLHMNFLLILLLAIVLTTIAGMLIGLPTLRLRGDYIAIVTLAFGEIIYRVAVLGDSIKVGGQPITAGKQGITPIDKPQIPFVPTLTRLDLRPWYYIALVLFLLVLFVNFRLRDSRLGRAWIALREDEVAAVSMGVPLVRTKLLAYGTGAAFGGMAGAFLASYNNTVNADQFQFSFSILILGMIILGGLGSLWGAVLGAVVLSFINNYFLPKVGLADYNYGIYGLLLVIMMVLRPEGLIPERRRQQELSDHVDAGGDAVYESRVA